jgi:hypothetical protein
MTLDDRLRALEERAGRLPHDRQAGTVLVLLDLIRTLRAERSAPDPTLEAIAELRKDPAVQAWARECIAKTHAERSALGVPGGGAPSSADGLVRVLRETDDVDIGGLEELEVLGVVIEPDDYDGTARRLRTALSRLLADARATAVEECAKECDRYVLPPDDGDVVRDVASETARELAGRIRAMAARSGDGGGGE